MVCFGFCNPELLQSGYIGRCEMCMNHILNLVLWALQSNTYDTTGHFEAYNLIDSILQVFGVEIVLPADTQVSITPRD